MVDNLPSDKPILASDKKAEVDLVCKADLLKGRWFV